MTSTTQSPSAIEDLYDRRILHGDISIANIMIAVNGSGRLIDLDLAWDRDEVGARLSVGAVSSQP
jgi:serine/threonine protein kinase